MSGLPIPETVESLLEEMKCSLFFMIDTLEWRAEKDNDFDEIWIDAYWKTPLEALLALKEKLSTNK